jgi:hypothetical protein
VQTHHDETRLTIPYDVAGLLGRIPDGDQHLPSDPRWNGCDQPIEPLLRGRPSNGFQPGKVEACEPAAPHGLDHVHQNEGQVQCISQTARDLRLIP